MLRQRLTIALFGGIMFVGWSSLRVFADDSPAKPAGPSGTPAASAGMAHPAASGTPAVRTRDSRPPEPSSDGGPDQGPGDRQGPAGPPPDGDPGDVPGDRGPGDRDGPRGPHPDGGPDGGPPHGPRDHDGRPELPPDGMGPGKGEPPGPPSSSRWPNSDLESMRTSDPEMYKLMKADADLDRQSRSLAAQYRQAPKEKRDQIRQQVEQAVSRHFEVRQERRLLELKRLKEELQSFQEAIDRRTKARKELIEKRMSDLLGSEEHAKF